MAWGVSGGAIAEEASQATIKDLRQSLANAEEKAWIRGLRKVDAWMKRGDVENPSGREPDT